MSWLHGECRSSSHQETFLKMETDPCRADSDNRLRADLICISHLCRSTRPHLPLLRTHTAAATNQLRSWLAPTSACPWSNDSLLPVFTHLLLVMNITFSLWAAIIATLDFEVYRLHNKSGFMSCLSAAGIFLIVMINTANAVLWVQIYRDTAKEWTTSPVNLRLTTNATWTLNTRTKLGTEMIYWRSLTLVWYFTGVTGSRSCSDAGGLNQCCYSNKKNEFRDSPAFISSVVTDLSSRFLLSRCRNVLAETRAY